MDKLYLIRPETVGQITPDLYGVFTEHIGGVIYDGIYVGSESDVPNVHGFRKFIIDKMRAAHIPLIRWPGGCFAETYNWRDGIGPRSARPVRLSWWTAYDGRYESNQVGTDEFLDFCNLCGAEPYFAANLTSMSPMDIRDWIDYCNSPEGATTLAQLRAANGHPAPYNVRLWGVGNENWGGGGNMTASYYINEYRRYATVMQNASPAAKPELIACGANRDDYAWTRGLMDGLSAHGAPMHGMAVHYYCHCGTFGESNGHATEFTDAEWNALIADAMRIQDAIERHWSVVRSYGLEAKARLCIDEWGCWHAGGSGPSGDAHLFEQQSTMRNAVVTALTLNIFNNHCDKIRLATVAQLVNNLHALFLAHDADCILTPAYHVFHMFRTHQGGEAFRTICDGAVSASASHRDGQLTVTLANLSPTDDRTLSLESVGFALGAGTVTLLAHDDLRAHNTFDCPERVRPVTFPLTGSAIELPRGAVAVVRAQIL